jgi:hypothetical protein
MPQECLILNNNVVHIGATRFNVAPPLQWETDLNDEVEMGWTHDGTNFVAPAADPTPLKDKLKSHITAYRYSRETGGMLFNGMPVSTDDRSKILVEGAYAKALDEANPTAPKTFKSGTGFTTIDNQTIIDIALAMADHVQKCFDAEKAVYEDIDNDIITTTAAAETTFENTYNGV